MGKSGAENDLLRFKKAAMLGFIVTIVWVGLVGGWLMVRTGSSIGWLGILVGAIMLLVPFTPPYRTFLHREADQKFFPISVFIANVLLIILYGFLDKDFLFDPYVLKNETNKASLIIWTGATILSIASLVVNIVVLRFDRRKPQKP